MPDTPQHRADMHDLAAGLKQAGFPQWLYQVELGDVWGNRGMSFAQRRDAIAGRLRESPWYAARTQDEDRTDILESFVEELGDAPDAAAFNSAWDAICDEADGDRVWIDLHGIPASPG
jgi:hypothetical protein